jgi:hypothetical protein
MVKCSAAALRMQLRLLLNDAQDRRFSATKPSRV